jgi:hypothetical protein
MAMTVEIVVPVVAGVVGVALSVLFTLFSARKASARLRSTHHVRIEVDGKEIAAQDIEGKSPEELAAAMRKAMDA